MRRLLALPLALGCVVSGLAGCAGVPGGSSPARPATTGQTTTPPATTPPATTSPAATQPRTTQSSTTRPSTSRPLVVQADRTHEYPAPSPHQTVIGGWRNPAQAVSVFADTYINWTAATLTARLQALAEVSLGQARSAMLLAAAQAAKDYELHRSGVANRGTVESVAPLPSAPRQYVVVTREQTTSTVPGSAEGLGPAWHVTLATVTRVTVARVTGRLWVLTRWQAES